MSKRGLGALGLALAAMLLPVPAAGQGAAPNAADRAVVRTRAASAVSSEVLEGVSRLRGLPVLRPVQNGLTSRADIRAMVLADLAKTTTPLRLRDTTSLLRFLGLVPDGFDLESATVELLTEQIAGYYDPKTRVFYLADWIPIEEQRAVIAHELTHALTDQHFDLRRFETWEVGDADAELAARALVEGDATALMIAFSFDERGTPVDLGRLGVSLTSVLLEGANVPDPEHPVFSQAPAVLRESLQFPYLHGAGFVQVLLREGEWGRVSAAYRNLPVSTEQIMHPEKYLANERPVRVALPDVRGEFGSGWRAAGRDVNGEFGYYLMLAPFVGETDAFRASAGWAGDRYEFFVEPGTDRAAMVHVSEWDTEEDAAEFVVAWSDRTVRRYGLVESCVRGPKLREWVTPAGVARIQRSGRRVAVVEGLRRGDAADVIQRMLEDWK